MYIVGVDVGGTNTDAALVHRDQVLRMAKVPTNHGDLFSSTKEALQAVLKHYHGHEPIHLHLSTTLSTNIIVEGKGASAAVVAICGPGANLEDQKFPFPLYEVSGCIDHRGREVASLEDAEIESLKKVLDPNLALAVVGKFSQRNPSQEQKLGELLSDEFSSISFGHLLSGRANFPRRITTAYLNASVTQYQDDFVYMVETLQEDLEVSLAEVLILKADGGTMTLQSSKERPVETILSGPAASIMGVQALTKCTKPNFLIVDIGGTTTDLAVVVENQALFEREGATIAGYKTLVPALLTRSIGLGGDSELHFSSDGADLTIGPQRAGAAVSLGGKKLTPTDAVVALNLSTLGDQTLAIAAFEKLGLKFGRPWEQLARQVLQVFTEQLAQGVENLYGELENSPLYTISEVLHPPQIRPEAVVGLGAPAQVFIPPLAKHLGLTHEIVPFSAGANAVGAAASQPTIGLTLHADTELGTVTIPELAYQDYLSRSLFFTLEKALDLAIEKTKVHASGLGYDHADEVYVVEQEQFNVVRGFHTAGQVFTVRTQLRPQVRKIKGGQDHDKG